MAFNAVPREYDASKAAILLENLGKKQQTKSLYDLGILFARYIFPLLDPMPFACLYKETGRPCYPVNIILAAEVLKQIHGFSDSQLIHAADYDPTIKIALHLYDYYDGDKILSIDTLEEFRIRNSSYCQSTGRDLMRDCFMKASAQLVDLIHTDTHITRIDTGFVDTHSEKLDRFKLLYRTTTRLVKTLDRLDIQLEDRYRHYLNPNDWNLISYHDKETPTGDKVQRVLQDMRSLIHLFHENPVVTLEEAWDLLVCVFNEQTLEESDGTLRLRKDKSEGLHSQTIQTPVDPDATYRKKAGEEHQGYIAAIVDTGKGSNTIRTYWNYATNVTSDEYFIGDYINTLPNRKRTDNPDVVVADGGFSSAMIKQLALSKNTLIINTNLSGKKPNEFLLGFVYDTDVTEVKSCPNHQAPADSRWDAKNEKILAHYTKEQCENCPHKDRCPIREGKRMNSLNIHRSAVQRAQDWANQTTGEDYGKLCSYRNGVECNFALLRNTYHIDQMPVRTYMSTRYRFNCVMMAINAKQVCKYFTELAKLEAQSNA